MTSHTQPTQQWGMLRQLKDRLISLTMTYLNSHPNRIDNPARHSACQERIIGLRDSVLYRFESLEFHRALLGQRHAECLRELRSDPLRRDGLEVVRWASRDLKFLFDDMVFTSMSLFDYTGSMVGFVLHDEIKRNIKWAGARKCATQATNADANSVIPTVNRIYQSPIGDLVNRLNDEWIKGLAEYRNALIHERSDTAGGRLHTEFSGGTFSVTVEITAPIAFTKRIAFLSHHTEEHPLELLEAASWVVTKTFVASVALTDTLTEEASRNRTAT